MSRYLPFMHAQTQWILCCFSPPTWEQGLVSTIYTIGTRLHVSAMGLTICSLGLVPRRMFCCLGREGVI